MRQKCCKGCGNPFAPERPMQIVCDYKCAGAWVRKQKDTNRTRENRAAKRKLLDNDRRHWLKKAASACNAYIRERDKALPCISCARHHTGQYHAGHYRPAGNNSALRFNEYNIHKQCSACNNHKSGNLVDYRINLNIKIGSEKLAWLEGPHELKKWTLGELKEITAHYKQKLKALKGLT